MKFLDLKSMRIEKRLVTSFILVALIVALSGIAGGICLEIVDKQYGNALVTYGFAQGDIGEMMYKFADMRSNTRAIIGYEDDALIASARDDYKKVKAEFDEWCDKVQAGIKSAEVQAEYDATMKAVNSYLEMEAKVQALGSSSDPEASAQAQDMAYNEMSPYYKEAMEHIESMMDNKVNLGNAKSQSLTMMATVIVICIVVLIIISMVIAVKLGLSTAKGIADPLGALAGRFETFSKGDLSSEFQKYDNADEVGEMNHAAIDMALSLNNIIKDIGERLAGFASGDWTVDSYDAEMYVGDLKSINEAMGELKVGINDTLTNIGNVSEQVSQGATGLAEAAQSLAEGATDQAGAVEELQATITNVAEAIQQTASKTQDAYRSAKEYAGKADTSRAEMERLTDVMGRITESSEKIGNIISEIENIASQTNLLSLNASIEAARAGEAGKGFAVVADQIGKLAEQSAQSAVDTRTLIESSLEEIRTGNSVVQTVAEAIAEVVEGVNNVAETSSELSDLSTEQAESMGQIEVGINQISEIVQSNSAAAEELSATSEEMLAQSEVMSQLVKQFKLTSQA